jgi:hypothetical protein
MAPFLQGDNASLQPALRRQFAMARKAIFPNCVLVVPIWIWTLQLLRDQAQFADLAQH